MITARVNEDYEIIIQKGNITTDTQVEFIFILLYYIYIVQAMQLAGVP